MLFQKKLLSIALLPVIGSYAQTLPSTITVTNSTFPAPTASSLPPVISTVNTFIGGSANSTSTASSPSSTTTETCASPTGFANQVVPAPDYLANAHFSPSSEFNATHGLFILTDLNIDLPEAVIARFCLDKCIAYGGTRICRSIFVNQGKPYPLGSMGSDNAPRWYCAGYDAPLSASVYRIIDAPESYLYGLGINRVCNGTFRAY